MKMECEILSAAHYLKLHCSETIITIFLNKAVTCCYNKESEYEELRD